MKLKNQNLLKTQALVNGEWVDAKDKKTFPVKNPATGETIIEITDIGTEQTQKAIDAAEAAFKTWKNTTAKERSAILRHWAQLLRENQDDMATLLTAEQGKPIKESYNEIAYTIDRIEWHAEEAKRVYGSIVPQNTQGIEPLVMKEPVGVVAAITPWNFPIGMMGLKTSPALAAGCTVVLKPSETTPLTSLALAQLAIEAGIPKGVLNVLPSNQPAAVGEVLTKSPIVRKLSFTGSTATGKVLAEQSAGTLKKVTLELGGNAPFIVFEDADIEAAVQGLRGLKFSNAGQICVCPNRVMVHESVYDEFVKKLQSAMQDIKVGDGADESTSQGPQNNQKTFDKTVQLVDDAKSKGAKSLVGGNPHSLGGTFYEPTLLVDVTRDMEIAKEEIFGPVAAIYKFKTEDEAIEFANDTHYGLAAYFYSRDIGRVWRVSKALEYGVVASNTTNFSSEAAPFGGMKQSGIGREGGQYGISEYLETKYTCMGL